MRAVLLAMALVSSVNAWASEKVDDNGAKLKNGTVACVGGIEQLVLVNSLVPKVTRDGKTITCGKNVS